MRMAMHWGRCLALLYNSILAVNFLVTGNGGDAPTELLN